MIYSILLMAWLGATDFLPSGEDPPATTNQPSISLSDLAGVYQGPSLIESCTLTFTPEGRFSFRVSACKGPFVVCSGDTKVVNGHLLLSLDNPNDLSGTTGLETDFVIVRWGQHLFLVPGAEKEDFCNGVNQGGEGLGDPGSNLYCRISKGDHKFTGVPIVPRDWAPLILQKPIEGKVIEVLAGRRARVDLGAESGVWKGMTLQVACTGRSDAVVTDVGQKTCVIATKYTKTELRWPKWSRSDPSASWGAILFKQGERVGSRLRKME